MRDEDRKKGIRTLLVSVLISAPVPLIMLWGLRYGRSTTQIADAARRSSELLALIVALIVYSIVNGRGERDEAERRTLERRGNRFSGLIMCLSGAVMMILSLSPAKEDKGNVAPALAIALLGAAANSILWRRYTRLYKKQGSSILKVQSRLYGAKLSMDLCVSLTLAVLLLFPASGASKLVDRVGTAIVSLYMIYCGLRTIKEQKA